MIQLFSYCEVSSPQSGRVAPQSVPESPGLSPSLSLSHQGCPPVCPWLTWFLGSVTTPLSLQSTLAGRSDTDTLDLPEENTDYISVSCLNIKFSFYKTYLHFSFPVFKVNL